MKNKKIVTKCPKIVAVCPAGLGNRIKCLISSIKRCEDIKKYNKNIESCIYWPLNEECGCKFNELFEYPIKVVYRSELYTIEVDAYSGDSEINKSWKLKNKDNIEFDFKYNKLTQLEISKFLPYFKLIKPKKDIQDTVWAFINKYKESFDKGEVIGVHIRKGDYDTLLDGRHNISKEDKFTERMRCLLEINPNYKFLICTEDEETEEKFRKRFGSNNLIYFHKQFRGRNTPNSIKEAFVDMLLLSKCNIILGTFLSTFTEVAWWLGKCKAQVYIPGAEDKIAVEKVLEQLPKAGEGIHIKIWRFIKTWKTKI